MIPDNVATRRVDEANRRAARSVRAIGPLVRFVARAGCRVAAVGALVAAAFVEAFGRDCATDVPLHGAAVVVEIANRLATLGVCATWRTVAVAAASGARVTALSRRTRVGFRTC